MFLILPGDLLVYWYFPDVPKKIEDWKRPSPLECEQKPHASPALPSAQRAPTRPSAAFHVPSLGPSRLYHGTKKLRCVQSEMEHCCEHADVLGFNGFLDLNMAFSQILPRSSVVFAQHRVVWDFGESTISFKGLGQLYKFKGLFDWSLIFSDESLSGGRLSRFLRVSRILSQKKYPNRKHSFL